jgi:O-antigen ligase
MVSPINLLCVWVVTSPVVTNFILIPSLNPLFGSTNLVEYSSYTTQGLAIRELFTYDRIVLFLLLVFVLTSSNLPKLRFKAIDSPFLFFLTVIVISVLFSNNRLSSARVAMDTFGMCYITYFLGKNFIFKDNNYNKFHVSLVAAGVFFFVISVLEFHYYAEDSRYRITGPFAYWENLALTLAIIFYVIWYKICTTHKRDKLQKRIYWFALIGVCVTIIMAQTRTIWFGMLIGICVLVWEGRRFISMKSVRKYVLISIIAVIFIFANLALFKGTSYYARLTRKETVEGRMETYKAALRMFAHSPIVGIGLKNFRDEMEHYVDASEVKWSKFGGTSLHNSYLVVASEMGIMGLIPMGFLILSLFKFFRKCYRRTTDPSDKYWALAMVGMTVTYFLSGMTFDPFFEPTLDNKLYYMCVGTTAGRFCR